MTPEAIFDFQHKILAVLVANRFMSICTIISFLLYCSITILSIDLSSIQKNPFQRNIHDLWNLLISNEIVM
jgi:hypothetical protein